MVSGLIRSATEQTNVLVNKITDLSKELGASKEAIRQFLRISGEQEVPTEQLFSKLSGLAGHYNALRTQVGEKTTLDLQDVLDLRDRVKFLLQNPDIPDAGLTYFLNEVLGAGVYAREATWSIDVEEYRPELNAYRVRVISEHQFANMFGHYPINFEVSYGYRPDNFPSLSPNTEVGRYIRIIVGKEDLLRERGPLQIPRDGIRQKTLLEMAPGETSVLKTEYVVLMAVGEEQSFRPQRFVNMLAVGITNHAAAAVRICVEKREPNTPNGKSDANEEIVLLFNREYRPSPVQGIGPGEKGYSFRFLPPS
jgi:hypothetical protein